MYYTTCQKRRPFVNKKQIRQCKRTWILFCFVFWLEKQRETITENNHSFLAYVQNLFNHPMEFFFNMALAFEKNCEWNGVKGLKNKSIQSPISVLNWKCWHYSSGYSHIFFCCLLGKEEWLQSLSPCQRGHHIWVSLTVAHWNQSPFFHCMKDKK